jgi:hypothetical protein
MRSAVTGGSHSARNRPHVTASTSLSGVARRIKSKPSRENGNEARSSVSPLCDRAKTQHSDRVHVAAGKADQICQLVLEALLRTCRLREETLLLYPVGISGPMRQGQLCNRSTAVIGSVIPSLRPSHAPGQEGRLQTLH